MALEPGARLGRYEILSAIGAGGMGEVYAARDTQLDRRVAIKLLPSASTRDADRVQRFVKEAKAASALNHPNIITVYEIGLADDCPFIATELVDGLTVRQLMTRGPMALGAALDVATQIAGALAASHAAGVVHRDIKPENVMVRPDGYVKVLDFGLAKLVDAQPIPFNTSAPTVGDFRTEAGVVLGTARYMSPEQTRGLDVDARSDIFSLGVVIYEMLAGRAPFDGATPSDLVVSILEKEPPPLGRIRPELPVALDRIVTKALRKNQDERYQTARDLEADLKHLKAAATVVPPITNRRRGTLAAVIAVAVVALSATGAFFYLNRASALTEKDTILLADFVNATGEPEFDGSTLKQALSGGLRQTPFLNLFPEEATRETLRMMGRQADEPVTREVGREISQRQNLKALLVGSIATLGRHYVLTLEVLNAQTGEAIASQQVEAEGKEQVLTALGQAATGLRRSLGESLSTIEQYNAPMDRVTTSSLEALKAFSAGNDQFMRGDARGALPLVRRALELDPNFAEAHDTLAWIYVNLGNQVAAAQSSERAFALRDRVTEVEKFYVTETYHHWVTGDWDAENELIQLAKRLFPNDWSWPHTLAINLSSTGRDEQAVAEETEAIRLNPNVVHPYRFLAIALAHLNRFDEARQIIQQTQARKLDGPFFRQTMYAIAVAQGDEAGLREQLDLMRSRDSESQSLIFQARAVAVSGRWRDALSLYRRIADLPAQRGTGPAPALLPEATRLATLFTGCQPDDSAIVAMLTVSQVAAPVQRLTAPVQADGALCGNPDEAERLVDEVERRFPKATMVKGFSVPVMRAAIALQRKQPEQALEHLKPGIPYERGWTFLPTYLRGQAYLQLGQGREAAAEFDRILEHRGWDPTSALFPLAYLGRARALASTGDRQAARKGYEDFFQFWKDADADLRILVEAKGEYARLP